MIYLCYVLLVALVIFLSVKISYYIDQLDKKTSVSSAFIGGVLLAAVTSLPELFTSISSVLLVGKPELVLGNILGSNLFNLFVLSLVFIFYIKHIKNAKVTTSHNVTLASLVLIYLIISLSAFTHIDFNFIGINIISIFILIFYIYSVRKMSIDEDTAEESEAVSSLSVPQILGRFVVLSILLILTSIAITYISDDIGMRLGIGSTLAGALLLGIATSLPEVISCFALAKYKNFNAMIGNIVGSNLFNLSIFLVADVLYLGTTLYMFTKQSSFLAYLGLLSTVAIAAMVLYLTKQKHSKLTYIAFCLIPIASYIYFLFI